MKEASTTVLPSPPSGSKARATFESLLAAAERLLHEQGVPALNSTAVAAEAGVATGTFYSYFADKDAVLAALFARGLDDIGAAVRRLLTADALLDHGLQVTLTAAVDAVLAGYRQHSTVIRAALGRIPDSELLRGVYWQRHEQAVEALEQFLRRGATAGLIGDRDPAPMAAALLMIVQSLNHPVVLAGSRRDSKAIAAEIVRALVALLAPD